MPSILKAIGSVPRSDAFIIKFYYQLPEGGRDLSLPSWEVPARSFEHMQDTVRAFNGD
ncbi:hypothetical protein D3C87_1638890 [compost metagenome]